MNKILVVEDELSIRSFICLSLKRKGFYVSEADTGEEAIALFQREAFDIVLLDLMLPGIDGFEVCQEIRKVNQKVGIIMLTARTQEKDKVEGLILGADDYLSKPFSVVELEARVRSLLRRMNVHMEKREILSSGPFQIDTKNKKLLYEGNHIKLTPTEYSILQFLMSHPDQLYTRDELLDEVWGENYVGDLKVIDVNIRRIRQKIENDASTPEYLCTEWGQGYYWKDKR